MPHPLTFYSYPFDNPGVPTPTVEDQVSAAYEGARGRLEECDLTLGDIAKAHFFYAARADFPPLNSFRDAAYPAAFPTSAWPSSTGVVTGGRGSSLPRFEMHVVAGAPRSAFTASDVISQWDGVVPKFSHVNRVSDVVLLAGQGAYRPDGTLLSDDPVTQAKGALATFPSILRAAGASVEGILSVTAFLTPSATEAAERAVQTILDTFDDWQIRPVLTVVPVRDLAFEGMAVEIEAVAAATGGVAHTGLSTHPYAVGLACEAPTIGVGAGVYTAAAGATAETAIDAFTDAAAKIEVARESAALGESGSALATVWTTHPVTHREARELLGSLGPDVAVTIAPIPARGGKAHVDVEVLGNISRSS